MGDLRNSEYNIQMDFEDGDRYHLAHVRALWLALINTIMN
jgi:hypothetical protein